jgi:hypothetical protein
LPTLLKRASSKFKDSAAAVDFDEGLAAISIYERRIGAG